MLALHGGAPTRTRPFTSWPIFGDAEEARLLRTLRGRFFAGRDLGMTGAELRRLRRLTRYAAVEPSRGEGTLGDATARGTVAAIQAALTFSEERRNGSSGSNGGSGLGDALVAVQGLGAVGLPIARRLLEAGARVAAWDPDPRAAEQGRSLGVRIVRPSRLVSLEADVFVPAASGGVVDEAFSRRCRARIVCGPANNQLAFRGAEEILARRGIVYVPDVLVGAGALIAGALRHLKGVTDPGRAIDRIGGRVADLLRESRRRGGLATETARSLAERRLARGR